MNNTKCETLKLRETPKAHEYQGWMATFDWTRVMPEVYGDNVMRYEPKGEKWTILIQVGREIAQKEQRLDGGRSEKA